MVKNRVSLIILTYKNFDGIKENIESCCKQDYTDIEVVLRDDGSQNFKHEEIEKIFAPYANKIKYKIIHDVNNHGTVFNFNEAIKHSTGEYIIVVSGDDYLMGTHTVSLIVQKFESDDSCECVTAREIHELPDGRNIVLPSPYEEWIIKNGSFQKLWYLISAHPCFIVGSVTSYRRTLFESMGLFDTEYKLLEDWPFYLHLFEKGIKISFLPCVTIHHSSGGVSTALSGNFRNTLLVRDDLKCMDYVIANADKYRLSIWQKKTLAYRKSLLDDELARRSYRKTKKKYWLCAFAEWFWYKTRNISLRLDVRKYNEK